LAQIHQHHNSTSTCNAHRYSIEQAGSISISNHQQPLAIIDLYQQPSTSIALNILHYITLKKENPPPRLGYKQSSNRLLTTAFITITIAMNNLQPIKLEKQRSASTPPENLNNNDLNVHPWNKYLADDESATTVDSSNDPPADIHPFNPNAKKLANQRQHQHQQPSATLDPLTPRKETSEQEADHQNRIFHMSSLLGDFSALCER
jgi:hypothetical protein